MHISHEKILHMHLRVQNFEHVLGMTALNKKITTENEALFHAFFWEQIVIKPCLCVIWSIEVVHQRKVGDISAAGGSIESLSGQFLEKIKNSLLSLFNYRLRIVDPSLSSIDTDAWRRNNSLEIRRWVTQWCSSDWMPEPIRLWSLVQILQTGRTSESGRPWVANRDVGRAERRTDHPPQLRML